MIKIGALWLKDKNGKKFMSGSMELEGMQYSIMVFKNERKEKPNQPDYQICLLEDRTQAAQPRTYQKSNKPYNEPRNQLAQSSKEEVNENEIKLEDVPF